MVFSAKLVDGEIVGYALGSRSLYGITAYNYRVRLEYEGEIYYAKAMQSKTIFGNVIPRKEIGRYCLVYFNPKNPRLVSMKGYYGLDIAAWFFLILGLLGIWIEFLI